MVNRNFVILCTLLVVLLCCVNVVSAAFNDTVDNVVYGVDSNEECVSVRDYEQVDDMGGCESVLSAQGESDNLSVNAGERLSSSNEYGNVLVVTNQETNSYLNDIKISTSDEFYKFVDYLINQKGFKFNTKESDDGYTIYSASNYQSKLFDGENYVLSDGTSYFLSKNRMGYVIDEYYPDILYFQNNNVYVDELYLGWLKNVEKYHPRFNIGGTNAVFSVDVTQISSQETSSNLPSAFDLRNVNGQNFVTPVKYQGQGGNCWAFASIAALESFLLKTEGKTYDFSAKYDFSENNLKNVMSNLGRQGSDYFVNDGGRAGMSIAYFLRWSGPISEELDKYILDSTNHIVNNIPLEFNNSEKHVQGVKYIHARNGPNDNDEIKQAIMNYGAVVTSMTMIQQDPYLDASKINYYYGGVPIQKNSNGKSLMHEVCIVGWNDTYPKGKFGVTAPGDGAFIVKRKINIV